MTPADVLLSRLPGGPLLGVEVGVLRGKNAERLLKARPDLLLYLVDNWQCRDIVSESPAEIRTEARNRLAPFSGRVIWQEFDSIIAAGLHGSHSLDFVYLDSRHEQDHVEKEIAHWKGRVRSGGLLAGHDYGHPDYPGVAAAVDYHAGHLPVWIEGRVWAVRL